MEGIFWPIQALSAVESTTDNHTPRLPETGFFAAI
jgi:hypothetical protein